MSNDMAGRFWERVEKSHTCWTFASTNRQGYGVFYYAGKDLAAHRVSYELVRGSIPAGLQIDHLCRNHACVNPEHLEVVTLRENVQRHFRFLKSLRTDEDGTPRCKNGHRLTSDALYQRPSRETPECRHCRRDGKARQRARRRELASLGAPAKRGSAA